MSYDQSDYPTILNFHHNGHDAPFKSITSVRGDMRPAVSGELGTHDSVPRAHHLMLDGHCSTSTRVALTDVCCVGSACLPDFCAPVSGQATLEMVFDEDLFSQTPPGNFYPLMHGAYTVQLVKCTFARTHTARTCAAHSTSSFPLQPCMPIDVDRWILSCSGMFCRMCVCVLNSTRDDEWLNVWLVSK